jgi:hypothetical protein
MEGWGMVDSIALRMRYTGQRHLRFLINSETTFEGEDSKGISICELSKISV